MSLYDVDGNIITQAYNKDNQGISVAYDINGNEYELEPVVEPLSWNMSDNYKGQILDVLDDIKTYKQLHPTAYAINQYNDVHLQTSGNEPNFVDYNKGYKVIDYMIFAGDMVNSCVASQFDTAVAYMLGASVSKKLPVIGNHEYGSYNSSITSPEIRYKSIINVPCVFKQDDLLIYYHDDLINNVRYIILNYNHTMKTVSDNGHRLDDAQFEWLASVLESAGSKDIILSAHAMLNPFIILEMDMERSWDATIPNQQDLVNCINAFQDRGTYTVTVDGVDYEHDFSNCTGNFVMYTCGHYHALGHGDFGFNMFTCPTLNSNTSLQSHKGITFYLIDKTLKTIKVTQCSSQLDESISFNYTYGS